MSGIKRKRSFSSSLITKDVVKKKKLLPAFGQHLDDLTRTMTADSDHSAYTRVDMPLSYSNKDKPENLHLEATFSTKTQNPIEDDHSWTQGYMDMPGETSYEKILPDSLSLRRTTFESRVMKKLAIGDSYTPETTSFPETTRKDKLPSATKNFGRIAFQSYLEGVTARTALGIDDIGSAMRARVLTRKLQMKTASTTSTKDFQKDMLSEFPQLLTAKTKGGASLYNNKIHKERETTPIGTPTATQISLSTPVTAAHHDLNRATRNRFNHKWNKLTSGTITNSQAGKWWVGRFGNSKPTSGKTSSAGLTKRALRRSYVQRKLARHNITNFS